MKTSKQKEPVYLTKRILLHTSKKAIQEAFYRAMQIAGYVVKVQNEWVVREYKDGTIQKILKLSPEVKPQEIVLD